PNERASLAISSIARNVGLALFITALKGVEQTVLPTLLSYMILGAIVAVPYSAWSKRRVPRQRSAPSQQPCPLADSGTVYPILGPVACATERAFGVSFSSPAHHGEHPGLSRRIERCARRPATLHMGPLDRFRAPRKLPSRRTEESNQSHHLCTCDGRSLSVHSFTLVLLGRSVSHGFLGCGFSLFVDSRPGSAPRAALEPGPCILPQGTVSTESARSQQVVSDVPELRLS